MILVDTSVLNNLLHGKCILWSKNENKSSEQEFKSGKPHGEKITYDDKGETISIEIFEDGKLISKK